MSQLKFYGKSEETVKRILDQFETGSLPGAIAPVFVKRTDNIPSRAWSWSNQFLSAIQGTSDARGYQQWAAVGRSVKKGTHAITILGPCFATGKVKDDETGEEKTTKHLYGFKSIPVFRIEDTEITDQEKWETSGTVDVKEETRLRGLPLREVAEQWGLNISSYNGAGAHYLGYYKHGQEISLGVENLSTWTHELIHAADDKNGTITKGVGQKVDNEVVAELGGATLLEVMGYHDDSDLGGAWNYIKGYAGTDTGKAIKKCMELINRICNCIDLVIKTSETVEEYQLAA